MLLNCIINKTKLQNKITKINLYSSNALRLLTLIIKRKIYNLVFKKL